MGAHTAFFGRVLGAGRSSSKGSGGLGPHAVLTKPTAVLGFPVARRRHPKEVEAALRDAELAGWTVVPTVPGQELGCDALPRAEPLWLSGAGVVHPPGTHTCMPDGCVSSCRDPGAQ